MQIADEDDLIAEMEAAHRREKMGLKVDDTIWVFNPNYRVYRAGQSGPIWREHWEKKTIVGETSRSWLINFGRTKIPKKELPWNVCATEIEVDEKNYVHLNAHLIAREVERIRDYAKLRQVAELIGYGEPK